jgi:hypothetical protein
MSPRPLDHLVMPVNDIKTARARMTTLGFTVAADARHPFGTENACVFFKDKSYLEPLGIASIEESRATARAGNQFTARNNAFRFRVGPEGLSAIVMGSNDADGDDATFREEGISGGDVLQFSRQMKLPDGSELTASFKLAFAADLRSPDFHGITCQRINVPPADRSALEKHANGVVGIKSVVLTEAYPRDFEDFLKTVIGQQTISWSNDGMTIGSANADIEVLNVDGARDFFGLDIAHERGLRGSAIVFKVDDITVLENHLGASGIAFTNHNRMTLVAHAAGQGVLFAFSE